MEFQIQESISCSYTFQVTDSGSFWYEAAQNPKEQSGVMGAKWAYVDSSILTIKLAIKYAFSHFSWHSLSYISVWICIDTLFYTQKDVSFIILKFLSLYKCNIVSFKEEITHQVLTFLTWAMHLLDIVYLNVKCVCVAEANENVKKGPMFWGLRKITNKYSRKNHKNKLS